MHKQIFVDDNRVAKIAEIVKNIPEENAGLNFYSFKTPSGEVPATDMYPDINDPYAVDFFFFAALHQHGFWFGNDNGYEKPLYCTFNGKRAKGSDAIWKALKRAHDNNPKVTTPQFLNRITPKVFAQIFSDDNGPIPFPDLETRFLTTREYAAELCVWKKHISPHRVLTVANESESSLQQFRRIMKLVPEYREDFYEKKTLLLAMILSSRPETFLRVNDPIYWIPIVDYHLMRLALRIGMVVVNDHALSQRLTDRMWVSQSEESAVRRETARAVEQVMALSGRSLSIVDHAFWSGRKFCPEMEKPNCAQCLFRDACAQKTELFQPVFRTSAY